MGAICEGFGCSQKQARPQIEFLIKYVLEQGDKEVIRPEVHGDSPAKECSFPAASKARPVRSMGPAGNYSPPDARGAAGNYSPPDISIASGGVSSMWIPSCSGPLGGIW